MPKARDRAAASTREGLGISPELGSLVFVGALSLLLLLKYGYGLHPQWFRFVDAAAHWPNVTGPSLLAIGDRALLSNSAPAWIAGALHLTSASSFLAFSGVLTFLAVCGPFLLKIRERAVSFNRIYFIVIAGGALAPVLLMWVGGYDALLVCGLTLGAIARNRAVSLLGWVLAAITHSSVAVPAAVLYAVYLMWNARRDSKSGQRYSAMSALLGVVLGSLAIHVLTDLWGGSTDRFTLFRQIPFDAILSSYAHSLPVLVISGLGIAWLLPVFKGVREMRQTRSFFGLALCAIFLLPLIAVDQTRIIALTLVPVTLAWIELLAGHLATEEVNRIWRRLLLPAILLPVGVVWMGATFWPYWL